MLSRNMYKVKKAPLSERRKKVVLSGVLIFSLFFITYGAYSFTKMGLPKGEKTEIKQDIGDRPLPKNLVVYVNADKGLNLRKERNSNSEKLVLIPNKTKLEVTEELEGWYKVSYEGKEGWISKEFTTQDEPAKDIATDWSVFSASSFKVKYPLGWKAKDYGATTTNKAQSVIAFSNQDLPETFPEGSEFIAPVVIYVSEQTLDAAKSNYSSISGVNTEEITLGSIPMTKFSYTSTSSNTQMTALVANINGKVLILTEGGGYQEDLINIAKTLSF